MHHAHVRKMLLGVVMVWVVFVCALNQSWAQRAELGDESWSVHNRIGRYFYVTHGTVVWGHEFGFFKDPSECAADTLFLTLSSSDERVKEFEGRDAVISVTIDGKTFSIPVSLLSVDSFGVTQVMMFTNWQAEADFLEVVANGKRAKVSIAQPEELDAFLDIKEDEFGLDGFKDSRTQAMTECSQENSGLQDPSVES